MKTRSLLQRIAAGYFLLVLALASTAETIVVTDDVGSDVRLDKPARRIVSLAPHLTEILFDLGVGDAVVGTVRYADYPDAARSIPRLGDAFSVSVESVIASRPDIVFAWRSGGTMRDVGRLESLGVPVYVNEAPTIDAIPRSVRAMSRLVGRPQQGDLLADRFARTVSEFESSSEGNDIRVFFQIADEVLYTVNAGHLIGQAITTCGAHNIFADSSIPVPLVGEEAVLAAKPDLIVVTHVPGSPRSSWFERWSSYDAFEGEVRGIDPNLISRPGLRMAEGIRSLCQLIDERARAANKPRR